ncbi:F-box domain-containing protein [Mycena venus]|uniref:F-box domain-containing protein n=1 Tax=Mycena venus TaxID=2733690 RepID=A0A8H6XVE6_9AGAR|nr:F-box domain-containing protein [Mycena venus]
MTTLLTLPSEITIKIFTTLIVDLGDASPEPVVLRLSSICKSLRDLVINSPTLWSRIRLRDFPYDMSAAALFVQRSQATLLEVSVYFDFVDHLDPEIILSYAVARWRKLTIRGPLSSEVKAFLQVIMETPTPDLTEVQLLSREQSDCNGGHCPLLLNASDALRALTMRGCVSCLAPFPNLTKLNIFRLDCTYEEFRNLILGSPNLTTLILGELQDYFPSETFLDPVISHRPLIEAPSVRNFAVGFTNVDIVPSDVPPLLTFLTMPNLEYLEVVGDRADYGELSGKPFPALKTLCLRDVNFPQSDAALYRSFTSLEWLELQNVQGVELLTAPDKNGATPWPHLRTLRSGFWYEENCSWLEKLLDRRPRLTLEVPMEHKDDVFAITGHDVRFFTDELSGLIRVEEFVRAELEDEEDWSDSDFDQEDFFGDGDNWDFEYDGMEDEVDDGDDYFEEDDDGLEGVEGWF